MARRNGSSARMRAREALAAREAARQEKESRVAASTEVFYEKVEAVEALRAQLLQAESDRDQSLSTLAGEGLTAKEISTLTGMEPKQIKAALKTAKNAASGKEAPAPNVVSAEESTTAETERPSAEVAA